MKTDDTILNDAQSHEDALLAQIEAGLYPGVLALGDGSTCEEVDVALAAVESGVPIFYRVSRKFAEQGVTGGAKCGDALLELPAAASGNVILAFDGYAADPRPLFQVREVVDYCRGMLLGASLRKPDMARAGKVLRVLFDEDPVAFRNGTLINPIALEAAGQLWLVGHAFPGECFMAHPESPTGLARDYEMNFRLREWLLAAKSGSECDEK